MATVKTLSKGQIVIPAEIRKKHHIEPGTEMQIMEYGGIIYLIPPVSDPVKAACGVLPAKPSLASHLLKERNTRLNSAYLTLTASHSPQPLSIKRRL